MAGGVYGYRDGLMRRKGRPSLLTGAGDGFVIGTTRPTTSNTGAFDSPRQVYTGPTVIDGPTGSAPHLLIEHVIFTRPITIRSGKVHVRDFEATNLDGIKPGFETALINTSSAGVEDVILERGTFDPGLAGAHHYLNAVTGHHTTMRRCRVRRVVDMFGSFNIHGPITNNRIEGCLLEYLVYFYSPQTGVVHPSDNRTHNDGIQHQGGQGLWVIGNDLRGIVRYPDGVTIPNDQGGQAWEGLAHQGVLTQQNVQKGTAINPVVQKNWVRGFQHAFVFKTAATGGTAYNAVLQDNLIDDDRRYYGVSSDYYGVAGGRPFTVRLDRATTVNGTQYDYPLPAVATATSSGAATSVEYQVIHGNNRYFNDTSVHAARRGQLITVRRDNFLGG